MTQPEIDQPPVLPDPVDPEPAPLPEPVDVEPEAEPEPEPALHPDPDPLADVLAQLARFDQHLEESQRLLGRQTDLVERLHSENQHLRKGEVRAAQLPLIRDLMRLHDDLGRLIGASEGQAAADLEIVRASLLDALARNGVSPFEVERGTPFDSKRQSAAGVVPTEDAELDRHVAETIRAGFAWDAGDLIRVAEVRVHRHVPAPAADTNPAASEEHE